MIIEQGLAYMDAHEFMEDITPSTGTLGARRSFMNRCMITLIQFSAAFAVLPLVLVFFYVAHQGFAALSVDFFTQIPVPMGEAGGGVGNAIVGSLKLVVVASLLSIPLGLLCGIYLSEFGRRGRFGSVLRMTMNLLASAPSIVVGLFAYTLIVVPMKGFSGWAGAAALALIMLPIVAKSSEEILKLLTSDIREAGLALGLPRWRVILFVLVKGSRMALVTGAMLAIARVAGETAPLLFMAFNNQFWASSMRDPTPSLPVQIYNYAMSPFESLHAQAWAGALVLVALVFALNLLTRVLLRNRGMGARR